MKFIAEDGQIFDSQEDCINYEDSCKKKQAQKEKEDKLKESFDNFKLYRVRREDSIDSFILVHASAEHRHIASMIAYDLFGSPYKFKDNIATSTSVVCNYTLITYNNWNSFMSDGTLENFDKVYFYEALDKVQVADIFKSVYSEYDIEVLKYAPEGFIKLSNIENAKELSSNIEAYRNEQNENISKADNKNSDSKDLDNTTKKENKSINITADDITALMVSIFDSLLR